jgi:hypothetical protein
MCCQVVSQACILACACVAGGGPRDVTLKLPCGVEVPVSSHLLQLASPFFRGALEDMKGTAIPVSE